MACRLMELLIASSEGPMTSGRKASSNASDDRDTFGPNRYSYPCSVHRWSMIPCSKESSLKKLLCEPWYILASLPYVGLTRGSSGRSM